MTRIASALRKARLVRRSDDPQDRRYVYLEATRLGVTLLEDGRRRRLERLTGLLAGLTAEERDACAQALSALARVLGR